MREHRYHFKLCATIGILLLLVSGFTPCFMNINTFSANAKADPPAGYNHRPIDEFFTSLACGPCVNSADPVQDEVWEEWGHDPAVRYNWVVFHTYAPDPDDLSTQDGRDRQSGYNPGLSNPTIIYDGGYIRGSTGDTVDDTKGFIDDSGTRDVERELEVYIQQEVTSDGIEFHYQIYYLGGEGNSGDSTPLVDDITAEIYIFVVEDNVIAYSTVIEDDYLCHNVFREYAFPNENEEVTIEIDHWHNGSVIWPWPLTDPTIPIQPHEVMGIIGVYDTEDTTSGEAINTPRLSNSANYKSTIWDLEEDVPEISNVQITNNVIGSFITADISDLDGISSVCVVYNITQESYNWSVIDMFVDGSGQASTTLTVKEGSVLNYTILAFDNNNLQSQIPLEWHTIPSISPGEITDLAVSQSSAEGEVNLTWTAPGDDNNEGTASKYYIRYSETEIVSESDWESSKNVTNPPSPQPAGTEEKFTVEGLTPGETFYFAIRGEDDVGNLGPISNSPSVEVPSDPGDITPPSQIDNLAAEPGETIGDIILTWTAPGDDGDQGRASKYYIKYHNVEITSSNWDAAGELSNAPTPQLAGNQESFTVEDLTAGETYFFAIMAEDDMQNQGPISNSPSAIAFEGDTTAPAKIEDLTAEQGENTGEILLTWTAPGDDGDSGGKASNYIIRYSPSDITSQSDWDLATDVTGEPDPWNPGSTESFTVTGLTPNSGYYFAIQTEDEVPNPSDISNTAYAQAPSSELTPPEISNVYYEPTEPTTADEVTIYATVTGDVESVRTSICKINEACSSVNMDNIGGSSYRAVLGQLTEGDYEYEIKVMDSQDEEYMSEYYYLTVTAASTPDNGGEGGVSGNEGETPWYESENGIYLIMLMVLAIVICSVIATAFAMSKRKAKPEEPILVAEAVPTVVQEPIMEEPLFTPLVTPQLEDISCPKCYTVFGIPTEPRPMQVECPHCSAKGVID